MENVNLNNLFKSEGKFYLDPEFVCLTCEIVVESFIEERKNGSDKETLTEYLVNMCVTLDIENEIVCEGVITSNMVSHISYREIKQKKINF